MSEAGRTVGGDLGRDREGDEVQRDHVRMANST